MYPVWSNDILEIMIRWVQDQTKAFNAHNDKKKRDKWVNVWHLHMTSKRGIGELFDKFQAEMYYPSNNDNDKDSWILG